MAKKGIEGIDYLIDDRYYCSACGSHSHREDFNSGCCYECGADSWEVEPDKIIEI